MADERNEIVWRVAPPSEATSNGISIRQAITNFIAMIRVARAPATAMVYDTALDRLCECLELHDISPDSDVGEINESIIVWYIPHVKDYSDNTQAIYVSALSGFLQFLAADNLAVVNMARLKLLIHQRAHKRGKRLIQFPADEIDRLIEYVRGDAFLKCKTVPSHLRALRDRAIILTLADTGLRIQEACNLLISDVDWKTGHALIIGKGDKQAVVRFSPRALKAISDYLAERGNTMLGVPIFGVGKSAAWWMIRRRSEEALGHASTIHPHSFRHYFVTKILTKTNNIEKARIMARHTSIATTQRYSHLADSEIDSDYEAIFGETYKASEAGKPPSVSPDLPDGHTGE